MILMIILISYKKVNVLRGYVAPFFPIQNESLAWLAPEVFFFREYYTLTDVWAFGVLMWEMWSLGKSTVTFLSQDHSGVQKMICCT